jgi:hypothetical protein
MVLVKIEDLEEMIVRVESRVLVQSGFHWWVPRLGPIKCYGHCSTLGPKQTSVEDISSYTLTWKTSVKGRKEIGRSGSMLSFHCRRFDSTAVGYYRNKG